jgi:hypothetical protein
MKGYCDHCKYARRLCGPNGSCEVRSKMIEERQRLYLVLMTAVKNMLQMKGRWESNVNVLFWLMYSQKWSCAASLFPKGNNNVLSPNLNIHVSVSRVSFERFETTETGTKTSFGTIRNKRFVSVVLLLYRNREFRCFDWTRNKQKTNRNSLIRSIFCYFSQKI